VVQDEDTILADSERVVARYHDAAEGSLIQIALAPCSPFSVTTSLMRSTADLASRLNVRMHTHLAETEDENRFCQELYKCRPLDYLENCGWLNDRVWLAHGIHFNDGEMKRLAHAGTTISHCPCSNQTLASGTCPVCAMEEAGVQIGIGVDGSASNDGSNLMQEVRAAFLLQRSRYGVRTSAIRTRCVGRRKARPHAPDEATLARSSSARWPILRFSSSTSCAFPAMAIRWQRLCCAAPIVPTESWWEAAAAARMLQFDR
jgi:cytosine/adenosine deaminase-related metal-dependent hydrolase